MKSLTIVDLFISFAALVKKVSFFYSSYDLYSHKLVGISCPMLFLLLRSFVRVKIFLLVSKAELVVA